MIQRKMENINRTWLQFITHLTNAQGLLSSSTCRFKVTYWKLSWQVLRRVPQHVGTHGGGDGNGRAIHLLGLKRTWTWKATRGKHLGNTVHFNIYSIKDTKETIRKWGNDRKGREAGKGARLQYREANQRRNSFRFGVLKNDVVLVQGLKIAWK